jgi:hypothetical protein
MRIAAKKSRASRAMAPAPGAPFAGEAASVPELAQFNQTIHELQERDNSEELVSVVKLYVADRAAGMLLLQDILAENEILSDSDSKRRAAASGISRKSAAREQADAAVADEALYDEALYVVAELDQLTAAFTAMLSREHPGVRMAVEEPIEIAALDADVQEQLQEIAPSFGGNRAMRRVLGSEQPGKFDKAQAPADGKAAADAPPPDIAKGAAKSGAKPEEKSEGREPARPSADKRSLTPRAPEAGKPSAQLGNKDLAEGDKSTDGGKGSADKPGAHHPPGSLAGGRAGKQNSASQDASGRAIAGHSRQIVVPMPEAIRRRTESGDVKLRSEHDSDSQKPAASFADDAPRRDEKAKNASPRPETAKKESLNADAEERGGVERVAVDRGAAKKDVAEKDEVEQETAQREPLLVKLLIVLEPEPAAARQAAPPAEKRGDESR